MRELIHFLPTYFAKNFGIVLQGFLFAIANDAFFFRASTPLTFWLPFPIPS